MKNIFFKKTKLGHYSSFLTAAFFVVALLTFTMFSCAAPNAPDPGPDDCYNRVTDTCNKRHPGKNLGDKVYRDCINDGLDWCDIHEPIDNRSLPSLDSQGRFHSRIKP